MIRFSFLLATADQSGSANVLSLFFDASYTTARGNDFVTHRSVADYPSSYDVGCTSSATAMSYSWKAATA
jgi:hypothetical protein